MRPGKVLAYVAFGLIVFVLALLVRLPASLVTDLVHDSASGTQVRLTDPRGSLWRGEARLSIMQTDFGRLAWRVSPLSMLIFAPRVDWQLQSSDLSGQIELGDALTATVTGSLDTARLAPILSRYAMSAEGQLRFRDLRIERNEQAASLSGQVDWSGGRVDLGLGNWRDQQVLPTLRAVATSSTRLTVTLLDDPSGTYVPAGEIELLAGGWVKLGVTGHLAKYFSQSLGDAENPAEIVLAVEEQLL